VNFGHFSFDTHGFVILIKSPSKTKVFDPEIMIWKIEITGIFANGIELIYRFEREDPAPSGVGMKASLSKKIIQKKEFPEKLLYNKVVL